jgi:peptidoglycan hydrolase CwlO-like protein
MTHYIRLFVASVFVVSCVVSDSVNASAATNSCSTYQSQVKSAQREVQNAQNGVTNAQNNFYRAQNQVEARTGHMEARIGEREANLNAVITSNVAWTGACVARTFVLFRGRMVNCANVLAASISRRARAEASLNISRSNLATYQAYSASYLQRMTARIVDAQNRLLQAQANLQTAQAQYDQCIATNY